MLFMRLASGRPVIRRWLTLATTAMALSLGADSSGQTCALQSPPAPFGENGYTGQGGYVFDYAADAGASGGMHYFQLLVMNKSATPLTFDWENAEFFRRGVAAGVEVRSQCRSDGNVPNVSHGLIKYGPNTQFTGPDARFYHYQRRAAQSMPRILPSASPELPLIDKVPARGIAAAPAAAQAPARAQPINSVNFAVKWGALLETGNDYVVSFSVSAVRVAEGVKYEFTNYGAPVQIDWPQILSPAALQTVRLQNAPRTVVLNNRLALPATKEPVLFSLAGKAPVRTLSAPLSVYTPDNLLLYRDVFTGLLFTAQ